jgi:hypothetical protein
VSHLENGNADKAFSGAKRQRNGDNVPAVGNRNGDNLPPSGDRNGGNGSSPQRNGANGNGGSGNGSGGGNGNGRLTAKQYRFLTQLSEGQGQTKADLDKNCVEVFGTVAQYLSKGDASAMIEHLLAQ